MPTDTKLNQLIINQLTQEQYDEAKAAGTLSDTELYITDSDDDALTNNKITNCITYIPQDIKLELNNGTLTLKAGSKVYIPNGTGVFDEVTTTSDIKITPTGGSGKVLVSINSTGTFGQASIISKCVSGAGVTPKDYGLAYDTTTNIITRYSASGSIVFSNSSFPLAVCSQADEKITSIDQVFNGFGYIGSTVFVLPGVKGLIPNSRNADGSLKNLLSINNSVNIYTLLSSETKENIPIYVKQNGSIFRALKHIYDEKNNFNLNFGDINYCYVGLYVSYTNGKITSFTPKTVFHALDYNDKSTISSWSMPSGKFIDLTLGADGSKYTAPANGYFQIWKIAGRDKAYFNFVNKTNNMAVNSNTTDAVYSSRMILPVRKGDVIECTYNSTGSTTIFRFIYAEGE